MKVLVIGAGGQLGWELMQQAPRMGLQALGLDLPGFDLTDPGAAGRTLAETRPEFVINASAYTAVDKAESDAAAAFAVNAEGPAYLASACRAARVPLVHVSTDYVFDGSKKGAYQETDPVAPLGVYGRGKAQGEAEVRNRLEEHLIVRTAWFYGVHGHNFVKTMLRLGREREVLGVVDDQVGSPTYAADLAEALLTLTARFAEKGRLPWGVYHFCGEGRASWHDFAKAIFRIAADYEELKVKKVNPLTTAEYPTPARRPANSVLDCSKFKENFNWIIPRWEESLTRMLTALYGPEKKITS
ncbi:MAG: dTDP-4-dehydrorhamnose reductase [Pseudomonadota bacterium]